jgi:hypothetical protein
MRAVVETLYPWSVVLTRVDRDDVEESVVEAAVEIALKPQISMTPPYLTHYTPRHNYVNLETFQVLVSMIKCFQG